ncbi:DUF937 domain-containing protein [Gynurincola endophyticus]|uniref:DUF937 domain-containing protein n=1 Tax=Gynurincola endophyticus TaxID=2479004 RepID=UPI000F8D1736|nr:DUF937 domain-containing protein [Gynurincola endophyticus]
MIENLINLIKEQVNSSVQQNAEIPNEKADQIVQATSTSLVGGLQSAMQGGGIQDIMGLFSGNGTDKGNPVIQNIVNQLINTLTSKVGLSENTANNFSNNLIPSILGTLFSKLKDPNDNSFNIQDILSQFSGGGGNLLNGLLDKDKDGDVDLNDITKMIGGSSNGGDNLLDKMKGLFGK